MVEVLGVSCATTGGAAMERLVSATASVVQKRGTGMALPAIVAQTSTKEVRRLLSAEPLAHWVMVSHVGVLQRVRATMGYALATVSTAVVPVPFGALGHLSLVADKDYAMPLGLVPATSTPLTATGISPLTVLVAFPPTVVLLAHCLALLTAAVMSVRMQVRAPTASVCATLTTVVLPVRPTVPPLATTVLSRANTEPNVASVARVECLPLVTGMALAATAGTEMVLATAQRVTLSVTAVARVQAE